jgi:hypothetical protein
VRDRAPLKKSGTPYAWLWEHLFSLHMARGAPPFINAQKMVEFSKEKVCFDLEMMVFLLPYDLGVMKKCFNGVKGWRHLKK